ncbi:MAG: hypothetical protein ABR613_00095 [Actinomycetota bacterium]
MRRLLVVVSAALILAAAAPAALAQDAPAARDPFVPLIAPTPPDGAADPTAPGDPTVPVTPAPPVDPLPDTGSHVSWWFGAAYFLVALGAGALVLSKVVGPPRAALR